MRTSRPVAEKLGTVRQDPDLHGLLFTLISRATGGRQERAARADRLQTIGEGRGLNHFRQSRFGSDSVIVCREIAVSQPEHQNSNRVRVRKGEPGLNTTP